MTDRARPDADTCIEALIVHSRAYRKTWNGSHIAITGTRRDEQFTTKWACACPGTTEDARTLIGFGVEHKCPPSPQSLEAQVGCFVCVGGGPAGYSVGRSGSPLRSFDQNSKVVVRVRNPEVARIHRSLSERLQTRDIATHSQEFSFSCLEMKSERWNDRFICLQGAGGARGSPSVDHFGRGVDGR